MNPRTINSMRQEATITTFSSQTAWNRLRELIWIYWDENGIVEINLRTLKPWWHIEFNMHSPTANFRQSFLRCWSMWEYSLEQRVNPSKALFPKSKHFNHFNIIEILMPIFIIFYSHYLYHFLYNRNSKAYFYYFLLTWTLYYFLIIEIIMHIHVQFDCIPLQHPNSSSFVKSYTSTSTYHQYNQCSIHASGNTKHHRPQIYNISESWCVALH
jgi:hypothetical protein